MDNESNESAHLWSDADVTTSQSDIIYAANEAWNSDDTKFKRFESGEVSTWLAPFFIDGAQVGWLRSDATILRMAAPQRSPGVFGDIIPTHVDGYGVIVDDADGPTMTMAEAKDMLGPDGLAWTVGHSCSYVDVS